MKPFIITSILAPTDLGDSSVPSLHYARLLADRFAAKVSVLYADPPITTGDFAGPAGALALAMAAPENQVRLRAEVLRHADVAMSGRPYDVEVTVGEPARVILAAAKQRNTDLIVMGTHQRHGWRRALLGSVSAGVLHGATCPVLTVTARANSKPPAIRNVMCPVNFTEVARESLHAAARIAEAFEARLTIVHVREQSEVTNVKQDEEMIRRWVSPDLQDVCSYRELVVRGGPSERVLDCADDLGADLLVIGAQHRTFRDASVIGTTTERLIRFALCPVLVIPREAVKTQSESNVALELAVGSPA